MKVKAKVSDIKKITIWGNHSPTMYPDLRNATIGKKKKALDYVD